MSAVLEARALGKRYRRRWALSDCTLEVPSGRIAGLVGPNGAGKTTLLNLATGLLAPTSGSIEVVGAPPAGTPAQLAKVGFVAQDTPVYASLSVADHLRLGAHLNPGWDAALARRRIEGLDLDPRQRAGKLSGGQRAQLALTLAIAKHPRLLLLDEPVASLDPLARPMISWPLAESRLPVGSSAMIMLGLLARARAMEAGLLSLMVTWWGSPVERASQLAVSRTGSSATNWFAPVLFDAHGTAPIGYAAFAFTLGVTAGVLIRHTVPAMAGTLAAYAGVQIAVPLWIRPHLMAPLRHTSPLNPAGISGLTVGNGGHMSVFPGVDQPGAWVISNQAITPAGHVFTGPATRACDSATASSQDCLASLGRLHLRQLVIYQPAGRYWAFQWYETGIFLVVALALAGFCIWWIRRRRLS